MKQGYSLHRMELLNWGNFQGWQVLGLSGSQASTDESYNSLIAGINGAGKSTLIDGIIGTLLPFDQALKLGVTHDSEAGTKGGRNIRDYVLGKYSSSGGSAVEDNSMVYSRRSGVSALILVFKHNSRVDDIVSVGRMWWYSDGRLREDTAAVIARMDLSIGDRDRQNFLDPSGRPFSSAGEFRRRMAAKDDRIQVFDKVTTYFNTLSSTFGGVKREDLKLLNQAFYLKSVSNIDAFVRTYMLASKENESMSRLISHVEIAGEISRNIERCVNRLSQINRILEALENYRRACEERRSLDQQQKLIQLYPAWESWHSSQEQTKKLQDGLAELNAKLPLLTKTAGEARKQHQLILNSIAQSEIASTIQSLELERENLKSQLERLDKEKRELQSWATLLAIKLPTAAEKFPAFQEKCREKEVTLSQERKAWDAKRTTSAIEAQQLEGRHREVREELQFAADHRTLIPKAIYSIKQECIRSLKIPEKALMFVGELIAVRPEHEEFRRAVESALNPISRNLLCLPEYLDAVTKWFNRAALGKTMTIKRIRPEELSGRPRLEFHKSSILAKIDVRKAAENPFHDYLWNWLGSHFYHRIVSVDEFKTQVDKAVTREGLVKQDPRTMRKYKADLEYSLGWDNSEREARLRKELDSIVSRQTQLLKESKALDADLTGNDERRYAVARLIATNGECLQAEAVVQRAKEIDEEIRRLTKGNKEFDKLKKEEERLRDLVSSADKEVSRCEAAIERDEEDAQKFTRLAEAKGRELEEGLGAGSSFQRGVEELETLAQALKARTLTATGYAAELRERIRLLDQKKLTNPALTHMKEYEREQQDPDLHYEIGSDEELPKLIGEWTAARTSLETTGLPQAKAKWQAFYNDTLVEAIKTAINDIRMEQCEIKDNIRSINEILKRTNFENLPGEQRYLQIIHSTSQDDRIRWFLADMKKVEKVISGAIRGLDAAAAAKETMAVLEPFVGALQEDPNRREFVVDVRNHYRFEVHSHKRTAEGSDPVVEKFAGSRTDAKSSAQTTQLAYTLLASALAYRFHFYDPALGRDSLRLIILDEFGGKFDNEKPRDIVSLLGDMGFQAILVSPMSKADLLAEFISHLVLIYKASASESKVKSHPVRSREEYDAIVRNMSTAVPSPSNYAATQASESWETGLV